MVTTVVIMADTAQQVPHVEYLVLGDDPHLVAHECTSCGARFFDRRNACASCFATDFRMVDIPAEGVLRTFTIVSLAAPGIGAGVVAAALYGTAFATRGAYNSAVEAGDKDKINGTHRTTNALTISSGVLAAGGVGLTLAGIL